MYRQPQGGAENPDYLHKIICKYDTEMFSFFVYMFL